MEQPTRKRQKRQTPWYESNLLWGPAGFVLALILAGVSGMVAPLWLAWVVSWITVWAVTERIAQPKCEPAYFVLGIIIFGSLLYGIRVGLGPQLPVGPQLAVDSVDDPMNSIPQSGQPYQPKVSKFVRIKVMNMGGKSLANVRVTVTKIDDRDCRYQLPLSSSDTLFVLPNPSPLVGSVSLSPGDDQYFEALVECNGQMCPSGELAIPVIEGGHRLFTTMFDNGVTVRPGTLTVRASGDAGPPVTRTFVVSPQSERYLTLRPASEQ
jgi:hypothetical protein